MFHLTKGAYLCMRITGCQSTPVHVSSTSLKDWCLLMYVNITCLFYLVPPHQRDLIRFANRWLTAISLWIGSQPVPSLFHLFHACSILFHLVVCVWCTPLHVCSTLFHLTKGTYLFAYISRHLWWGEPSLRWNKHVKGRNRLILGWTRWKIDGTDLVCRLPVASSNSLFAKKQQMLL